MFGDVAYCRHDSLDLNRFNSSKTQNMGFVNKIAIATRNICDNMLTNYTGKSGRFTIAFPLPSCYRQAG
jgi:hypothetical protein